MEDRRKDEDHPPSTADAYAPPPRGARSTKVMAGVLAIVAVCVVVFFLVLVLG